MSNKDSVATFPEAPGAYGQPPKPPTLGGGGDESPSDSSSDDDASHSDNSDHGGGSSEEDEEGGDHSLISLECAVKNIPPITAPSTIYF